MNRKKEFFIDALHIFILSSFAFAQPLFHLLSRNAEFFVARHSRPVDIIFLIIILCILLPTLWVIIEIIAGSFGQYVRKGIHYSIVAGLIAAIALPALKKILEPYGNAQLIGASIIGIVITITYIRFHIVRMFMSFLSPAILLFPGLFLFNSPVFNVVFPEQGTNAVTVKVDNPPPIIMVVFDEFPTTSLMNEHRLIDSVLYPNFAALAQDAYWFRNATTVAESSLLAVPAILSGSYPKNPSRSLPTTAHYPHNLFTLLGGSYEMKVFESHTMICPETLCGDEKRIQTNTQRTITNRIQSMLSDLSIVYLHIVLPSEFVFSLPTITQTWKDFWVETNMKKILDNKSKNSFNDRAGRFTKFIQSITKTNNSTLYFMHIMIPHVPWEYLPSGKKYPNTGMSMPGLNIKEENWGEDKWLVTLGYQRHLLQVSFVDKLLGDMLGRLKSLDLYDKSLIVITADHGVNFWPNMSRRSVTKDHPMDILPVPLFIKLPNQNKAVMSDRNMETIDILPTIADILNIELPWSVDGRSVFDQSLQERTEKIIYHHPFKRLVFHSVSDAQAVALKHKVNQFGSVTHPDGVFKIGPNSELVGRNTSEVRVGRISSVITQLDHEFLFADVDPDVILIPARITGRLVKNNNNDDLLSLAFAVNGKIQAVTQTYNNESDKSEFSAIVPETAFQRGRNKVEVFVVSEDNGKHKLMPTKSWPEVTYTLTYSKDQTEIITSSDGKSIQIVPNALKKNFEVKDIKNNYILFSGWAADVENSQVPEAIVIFVNGQFFYSGWCNTDRPDVATHYGNPALKRSGFNYMFPLWQFKDIVNSEVRIFAISKKSVGSELHYSKENKWSKKKLDFTENASHDTSYKIVKFEKREEIINNSNGIIYQVVPGALNGFLDSVKLEEDRVRIFGWAADVENSELPESVVIFLDGEFFFAGKPNAERPDMVKVFGNEAILKAGFKYIFPRNLFYHLRMEPSEARIFALSRKGVASELQYPQGYKWLKPREYNRDKKL
jgi:hypothetical protein